jgi:D-glycero-alpha-D-manno-heptose-7-phosphate kinase
MIKEKILKQIGITARAPLRIGLAGGGTDVDPYASMHGGFVLNATINRYAYTFISKLNNGYIELEAQDRGIFWRGRLDELDQVPDGLMLHRASIVRMMALAEIDQFPSVRISTLADSPVGSGLGTSSTVVVSIVQALSELLEFPLGEYDLATIAFEIERIDCKLSGGGQDHYAAAFGGVNFMEFYASNRVVVNPLRIKDTVLCDLEASLVLYFTGVSRKSAEIIDEQQRNVVSNQGHAVQAMHDVKEQALTMKRALLLGDLSGLADALRLGWEAKKKMAVNISNTLIDEVYERAINKGALAGKVSGAGGGGFMMFLVEPAKRFSVIDELSKIGGSVFPCGFSKRGAMSWRS